MKPHLAKLAAIFWLGALSSCADAPISQTPPPNVVIILFDDLGFSDIGAFGSEIRTPAIDELAAGGRSFSQFYVHPRCSPTRASLMTGKYPHQVGLGLLAFPRGSGFPAGPYQGYLTPETPTLASELKTAGYRTYMSGKWHLGEEPESWPRNFGFDRYFGLISGASSYYEIIEDQPRIRRMALDDAEWFPPEDGFFMTDATTDYALEFLQDHVTTKKGDPFFLYVAYTAPHWPLHASEADIDAYDGVYDQGWSSISTNRSNRLEALGMIGEIDTNWAEESLGDWADYAEKSEWARRMQTHAAMVTAADRGIGQIRDALKSAGELDNTLILVLSDNGASSEDVTSRGLHDPTKQTGERGSYIAFGEHGAFVANAPLRDAKGSVHDGGVRSPLIVSWPKRISGGERDHSSIFGVMDIPTSLLSIADVPPAATMEGGDMSDALLGKEIVSRSLYWEHLGWRGVRNGNLKAISGPGQTEWQLFDLSVDPTETTNISGEKSDELEKLKSDWENWSARIGAEPIPRETLTKLFGDQSR